MKKVLAACAVLFTSSVALATPDDTEKVEEPIAVVEEDATIPSTIFMYFNGKYTQFKAYLNEELQAREAVVEEATEELK